MTREAELLIDMWNILHREGHKVVTERNYDAIKKAIQSLEQESKTGHWVKSDIPNEEYVCSECGGACWYYDYQASVARSRFCPNCGAKMESEVSE